MPDLDGEIVAPEPDLDRILKNKAVANDDAKLAADERAELDDFGLPIRKYANAPILPDVGGDEDQNQKEVSKGVPPTNDSPEVDEEKQGPAEEVKENGAGSDSDEFKDAVSSPPNRDAIYLTSAKLVKNKKSREPLTPKQPGQSTNAALEDEFAAFAGKNNEPPNKAEDTESQGKQALAENKSNPHRSESLRKLDDKAILEANKELPKVDHARDASAGAAVSSGVGPSEFSHQQLTTKESEKKESDDGGWQTMPVFAPYDIYDDDNRLIAKEYDESADETYGYAGLGGAGKGYTRILVDDDAESASSMDENTQHLFKEAGPSTSMLDDEDVQRDAVSQLQATKDLLSEGQRIAYVGLTRLELSAMLKDTESLEQTSRSKKELMMALESMRMWSQKMMVRLYRHMDISPAEQVMIEQLASHGVVPRDMTGVLMANARAKNPMADKEENRRRQSSVSRPASGKSSRPSSVTSFATNEKATEAPPPYEASDGSEIRAQVRTPMQKIDMDLRWTVLCDLFLVLIADSIYDARSRALLERVGKNLEIAWIDICRFEKKVTDALEMQQNAERENWNEGEHMENRRKLALKRRYVMMGLATVGGGLVIGLSAGLLAPVIGAGLAAGFTTIGVTGTSGFLAGAGGAAVITSGAAASGSYIGAKASSRRTGAVKTFEYRPLHNNKRVNLIVTVSGWMTGKVDDVRLPFSTVDPLMGDIYSVLWEPDLLQSMGDTINILATEALTQGLQQVLGSTILISLMAALQLPIVLTKLAYLIDNPWAVSLDRATMAGHILADSLIDRNLGTRPITLVGYSLGSRVIYSCLQELARRGAHGLVQNVYLFGSPVVVKQDEYLRARAVVAGRFVNGFNRNDWILGYLFRLTNGGIRCVAGLAAVNNIPAMENFDVTDFVVGHMDYRTAMPRLLRECGWLVESDDFTEIEDPDPDKYAERQRELINEIEEARKVLEKENKTDKGGFASFFMRKKGLAKQEWEVYEDSAKAGRAAAADGGGGAGDAQQNNHAVLFNVDAIRAELAKEHEEEYAKTAQAGTDKNLLQIREIKTTLPPMKLDLSPEPSSALTAPARIPLTLCKEQPAQPSHELGASYDYRSSNSPGWSNSARSDKVKDAYQGAGGVSRAHDVDSEISMTFDTSFEDYHGKEGPTAAGTLNSHHTTATTRPRMKTAHSLPKTTLNGPRADADELDDPDFGKEKEIEMTFA